jgi:quercetin dioxygenase-like cupin family protein
VDTIDPSEIIHVGQIDIQFRVQAAQSGGAFTMFEYRIPVRARVPVPHSHETFDETVYGLDGVTAAMIDGRTVSIARGDVVFIPRGIVHHIENLGDVDARGLSVVTPGLLGPGYFSEVAAVLRSGGPPDVARIAEIMRRHGLRPVPPAG